MTSGTLDTPTLTKIINQCFAKAIDDRYTDAQQSSFLLDGKRLRGQLLNLLSAKFDDASDTLKAANASLSDINDKLEDDADALANATTILGEISTLVLTLDNLLTTATSFV